MSQNLSAITSKFLFIMRASGSSSERESKFRRMCVIERVYHDIKFGQKKLEACICDLRSKNAWRGRGKRNKTAPVLCKCEITKQAQASLAQLAQQHLPVSARPKLAADVETTFCGVSPSPAGNNSLFFSVGPIKRIPTISQNIFFGGIWHVSAQQQYLETHEMKPWSPPTLTSLILR